MAHPIQRFPGQLPNVVANVDEEMVLQAIEFARNVGKYGQVLKDEKKVLRKENAALKERIEKLPSLLESELRSVKEDILARMHTVSFKINELIQSYTKFCEEKGAVKRPDALDSGALHAVKNIMPWLETCKTHVDSLNNDELEALLKSGLEILQLEDLAQEQNEAALIEPLAAPENRAVVPTIAARLQQIAEKMNNREKKVALIKEENSVLLEQIKKLSSGSQNIEKQIRNYVYAPLEECQAHLILLNVMSIPKSIKKAIKLSATATRTRDKDEIKGYIERCNATLPEIRTLLSEIKEIEKTIKGAS
jgi:cell division protein FtsB